MDIQLEGGDLLEGRFLARFLPQPLPANPPTPGPFTRRRFRVIHPLVQGTHPIIDAYDKPATALGGSTPREQIRRILDGDEWSLAGIFRLAFEDLGDAEPDQGNVTVLVTTRPASMSPSRAEAVVRAIGRLLASIDLLRLTAIEIRDAVSNDGELPCCASGAQVAFTPDLYSAFRDKYVDFPCTGASLGPAGVPKSGSIQDAVRPPATAAEEARADATSIAVDSPSAGDHKAFLAKVETRIWQFETDLQLRIWEAERDLDELPEIPRGLEPLQGGARMLLAQEEEEVAQNRTLLARAAAAPTHLGVVRYSSGLGRTADGSRDSCILDWAAVKMDADGLSRGTPGGRVNVISPRAAPGDTYRLYAAGLHPDRRTSSRVGDIKLSDEEACVKMGRTTGITRGYVNAVKPDCRTAYKLDGGREVTVVSTETTVISAPGGGSGSQSAAGFSDGGDSGSLVFDSQGNAIAMLWAGDRSPAARERGVDRVHYVTPLSVLLPNIEKSLRDTPGRDGWELSFV